MNILVFGAPGSGKSTHGKYIADKLELPYIYTGDLFRNIEKEQSEIGEKVRALLGKGLLIPDDIAIVAFEQQLSKIDISDGVVLDGFPRTLKQAQSLKIHLDLIFHFTIPRELSVKRLSDRARYDDDPKRIEKRIRLFDEKTAPIIDFFKQLGVKVFTVDNSPPLDEARKKINGLLKN